MTRSDDEYIIEILRLEGLLRAYLHRFAPKPADLEDLLQETYARLLKLPPERRAQLQLIQAFALTTARNIAVDWSRRRRVVPIDLVEDLDSLAAIDDGNGVEDIVHAHQELVRLAEAIATLPTRCAEVFTMRKVYGWSQREIAEHFNISISTVEAHLVKGVRRCVQHLAQAPISPAKPKSWFARWKRKGQHG
jgi:RNA polymerase sigma factor (sigma-70 family)